ncbi:dna mismatch repair protein [Stylonychia lemnae]|uniref:Dna mismatch repair protein n=1 Tax=Stylonychia lemnae TaxID=5949 RepID=A0A078A5X7_STYLE|nr:dna mismatch repair protein [Stylonychia lemnae]|eukprot:CDW77650.1 dna mismatch repair protein [Stylonychia lemnae]
MSRRPGGAPIPAGGYRDHKQVSQYKQHFDILFNSDIPIHDLNNQLRIWVAQLVENAVHSQAKKIEVRLIMQGKFGFDIIDDGSGIPETEFDDLCKCFQERQSNQKYKTLSLGYRGEALCSLSKCSELKVITRYHSSKTGYEVTFKDCEIGRIDEIMKDRQGTIVSVRNIHGDFPQAQIKYQRSWQEQYQNALNIMNDFSMILYNVTLILSNEFVNRHNNARTIRHFWQTHGPGSCKKNLDTILNNYYSKTPFCATPNEITLFEKQISQFKIIAYLVRPYSNGELVNLTKKNIHYFFNHKPAEIPTHFKTAFYNLYQDFKVNPRSLPFVFLHFVCEDQNAYDIVNALDIRYIKFPGESMFLSKMRAALWEFFRSIYKPMPASYNLAPNGDNPDENGVSRPFINPYAKNQQIQQKKVPEDPMKKEQNFKSKVQMIQEKIKQSIRGGGINENEEYQEEPRNNNLNLKQSPNSKNVQQYQQFGTGNQDGDESVDKYKPLYQQSPIKSQVKQEQDLRKNQSNLQKKQGQKPNQNQGIKIDQSQNSYTNSFNKFQNQKQNQQMKNVQSNIPMVPFGSADDHSSTNSTTPQSIKDEKIDTYTKKGQSSIKLDQETLLKTHSNFDQSRFEFSSNQEFDNDHQQSQQQHHSNFNSYNYQGTGGMYDVKQEEYGNMDSSMKYEDYGEEDDQFQLNICHDPDAEDQDMENIRGEEEIDEEYDKYMKDGGMAQLQQEEMMMEQMITQDNMFQQNSNKQPIIQVGNYDDSEDQIEIINSQSQ